MIELEAAHLEQMIAHARREAPNEVGGLLIGHARRVERVLAMRNVESSAVAFRLDAEEQYRAFIEMEDAGEELVGIYHSHPRSRAYPSPTDVRMSYSPEVYVVVVSLREPDYPTVRAFKIRDETITEYPIAVR